MICYEKTFMSDIPNRPDLEPIPLNESGNRENIRTFEYDVADTNMLYHALCSAVGMSMAYGAKEAKQRLIYYREQLKKLAPPAVKFLDNEFVLPEIVILSHTSETWSFTRQKEHDYSKSYTGIITVGNRTFRTQYRIYDENRDDIIEMIKELIPLSCRFVETEDIILKY